MLVDRFKTPVGYFKVYKNSELCTFSIEESTYNTYWLNGDIPAHPEGCYKIILDITKRGYIFKIKDKPEEYRDKNIRKYIELSLVWEKKEKNYAWDIVSFLTS